MSLFLVIPDSYQSTTTKACLEDPGLYRTPIGQFPLYVSVPDVPSQATRNPVDARYLKAGARTPAPDNDTGVRGNTASMQMAQWGRIRKR